MLLAAQAAAQAAAQTGGGAGGVGNRSNSYNTLSHFQSKIGKFRQLRIPLLGIS
jgi:hypothetical protein